MGRKKQHPVSRATRLTSVHLKDMLSGYLRSFSEVQEKRPLLILEAWPEVIGERLAPMAKAVSFTDGVLTVKVNNASLYSLLMQHEKTKLLNAIREKFPSVEIKTITFRRG